MRWVSSLSSCSFLGGLNLGHLSRCPFQDEGFLGGIKLGFAALDVLNLLGVPDMRLVSPLQELLLCHLNIVGTALKFFPAPAVALLHLLEAVLHELQEEVISGIIVGVVLLLGGRSGRNDELVIHTLKCVFPGIRCTGSICSPSWARKP